MAVLFFYSGTTKLLGDQWWHGDALWLVFSSEEYYNGLLLDLFARHYWLVNIATYSTVLIELAYPFLIWQRATRPYLLAAAILLHVQFAVFMGLFYFSFVMIMGHLSFVRIEWLRRLGTAWKRAIGDMEMIYDGKCGFCVRSMVWFLAFDGLQQIRVRDVAKIPRPWSATRKWRRRSIWCCPTGGRCRASRLIDTPCCACPGIVVANSVVLRAGVQPSDRTSDIQLGRRKPKLAVVAFAQPTPQLSGVQALPRRCGPRQKS